MNKYNTRVEERNHTENLGRRFAHSESRSRKRNWTIWSAALSTHVGRMSSLGSSGHTERRFKW